MTKENFDNLPVTKADLKNFATKDDLKELGNQIMSTKDNIKELLEAIQLFSGTVDKEFKEVKTRLKKVESTMVTKDYLDEKLGDLRGDMTVLIRKEDNKMKTLVEVLVEKEVLNQSDKKRIYSMEPFAQI